MKWGLIALNGKTHSLDRLNAQIKRYLGDGTLECVIGVDGGCKLLDDISISPDIIIGDFDSVDNIQSYKEKWTSASVMTFPSEKDDTDAELAFDAMNEKNMDRVMVIGGFGGRADHMISILHLIGNASNYVMIDEQNYIEIIDAPCKITLKKSQDYISLIPFCGNFTGVTLSGFKYPLNKAVIDFAQTLGISNEIVDDEGVIEVENGRGYLIISTD